MARAFLIEMTTTACIATLSNGRFADELGVEDPDLITMDMFIAFNGLAGSIGDVVSFARNATTSVKNAAIRTKVNALLQSIEGAGPLSNANIQIVGLPI
jgi:hypothetical protein